MSKIAKNSFHLLINRLSQPLFGFILMILIGYESSEMLGKYTTVSVFYVIFQTIPLLGLTPYIMRKAARDEKRTGEIIGSSLCLGYSVALLLFLAFFVYASRVSHDRETIEALKVAVYTIFPFLAAYVAEVIFVSREETRAISIVATVEGFFRLIVSILALQWGYSIIALFWVIFAGRVGAAIAYLFYLRPVLVYGDKIRISLPLLTDMVKKSPVFLLNSVLFLVVSRADFVILAKFNSAHEIGLYAVAYKILDFGLVFITTFISVIYPLLSKAYEVTEQGLCQNSDFLYLSVKTLKIVIATTFPICLLIFLLADPLVTLLFPKQHPKAVHLLQIMIFCLFFSGIRLHTSGILFSSLKQRTDLISLTISSVIYLLLLMVLVPRFGIYGAALACLLEAVIQMLIRIWYVRFALPVSLITTDRVYLLIVYIFLFTLSGILYAQYFTSFYQVIVGSIVFIVVYIFTVYYSNIINLHDMKFLGLHRVFSTSPSQS